MLAAAVILVRSLFVHCWGPSRWSHTDTGEQPGDWPTLLSDDLVPFADDTADKTRLKDVFALFVFRVVGVTQ